MHMQVFSRSAVALACAQETLRLRPPVKLLFRRTTKDVTIGDVAVPKNTDIGMSARKVREPSMFFQPWMFIYNMFVLFTTRLLPCNSTCGMHCVCWLVETVICDIRKVAAVARLRRIVTDSSCMQAIRETGNGNPEFDPQQWLSEDRTECTVNKEMGNFVFGKGIRSCPGHNLAIIELVTVLAVLGREVSGIKMSEEEIEREFFIIGNHPTGLPLTLQPRSS